MTRNSPSWPPARTTSFVSDAMPRQLHILTRPADELVTGLLTAQHAKPENTVEVVDLTQPEVDYAALVGKVFAADSVATW